MKFLFGGMKSHAVFYFTLFRAVTPRVRLLRCYRKIVPDRFQRATVGHLWAYLKSTVSVVFGDENNAS